jgi:hypothetical protein
MPKKKTKREILIYQLKIVLREIEPPIWRVLQIKGNANLGKVHDCIQGAMGWKDCHLHEFRIKGQRYRAYDQFYEEIDRPDMHDERDHRLNKLLNEGDSFEYIYDFGDCWEHDILVEKILPRKEGVYYPICSYGERACPPEDCGSSIGYEELLKVLADPTHEDHKHFKGWAGEDYDPEVCDLKRINIMLDNIKSNLREPR